MIKYELKECCDLCGYMKIMSETECRVVNGKLEQIRTIITCEHADVCKILNKDDKFLNKDNKKDSEEINQ